VLGADTRSTSGDTVSDKNCEKIHRFHDKIWCCGAGTAGDTEAVTGNIESQLELHRMATGKALRVVTAVTYLKRHLFKYQGNVSAACVLGGVDVTGPHLYCVYPHGSVDKLPYAAMGSGSLAAMALFETKYKADMTLEEAMALCTEAVKHGIDNDTGSGGNIDLMVITPEGHTHHRNIVKPNERKYKRNYHFPVGTTTVLSEKFTPLSSLVTVETEVQPTGAMEIG